MKYTPEGPFIVSSLKVGIHAIAGSWYSIEDAKGTTICRVSAPNYLPHGKKEKEQHQVLLKESQWLAQWIVKQLNKAGRGKL